VYYAAIIAKEGCNEKDRMCLLTRLSSWHVLSFTTTVQQAMENVRDILEKERNVQLAEHQEHEYADKFALVEQQTHSLWRSLKSIFARLGLDLSSMADAANVTLFFEGKSLCEFDKETEVEEVGDGVQITVKGNANKVQEVRKYKHFHWNITKSYEVYACAGSCEEGKIDLKHRSLSTTITTKANRKPVNDRNVFEKVNISWWTDQVAQNTYEFSIDRSLESCLTPRRNEEVEDALEFHARLFRWCSLVTNFLAADPSGGIPTLPQQSGPQIPPPSLVPLLENSTVLSAKTLDHFLDIEKASLDRKVADLQEIFGEALPTKMLSADEAILNELLNHIKNSILFYQNNVDYVEDMLRKQLVQAIGREITPEDFDQYMNFHNKKLFLNDYAPSHFSHAIRRPKQYPVGIVSIESGSASEKGPVQTFSRHISGEGKPSILIPIDAATSVELTGDRFLSGWIRYQFDSQSSGGVSNIVARARQFSSYMLLIGTMSGPRSFDPKNAIILQNKDEVVIPLLTEVLPSAKDFKDAIASMSPEQQEFARAFRAMQLESSVFAVCLIQLKPQLEMLLNLPDGSLSKEIKVTEDLMSLFIDFQIPSDLLSYDGPHENSPSEKVEVVKKYVDQVLQVLEEQKKEQLREERDRHSMHDATHNIKSCYDNPPEGGCPSASPSGTSSEAPSTFSSDTASSAADNGSRKLRSANLEAKSHLRAASFQADFGGRELLQAEAAPPETPDSSAPNQNYDISPVTGGDDDFTSIPGTLDTMLEEHDTESYLRSTILKADLAWTRKRQPNLLSPPQDSTLISSTITSEKRKAFDLLDAISRSGTLPIASSELHVVIGVTHCFERSLIETVIRDNINPIEKAEKSALLVASTIYNVGVRELIGEGDNLKRLSTTFPSLFHEIDSGGEAAQDSKIK
jgi:hypothetical protein